MDKIRKKLFELSDEKYKKFSLSLLPETDNLLGVRLPILRKLAKEIIKCDYEKFLNSKEEFFEETMLKGMVIGAMGAKVKSEYIEHHIKKITNWSLCDSFVSSLKIINKNKPFYFSFIQKYLFSKKEFEIRFSLVVLLNYFVCENYIDEIFNILEKIYLKDYYAKMAAAWLISICYVKYKEKTLNFLNQTKIDKETLNKGIQKIIESRRVKNFEKEKLKKLKKPENHGQISLYKKYVPVRIKE